MELDYKGVMDLKKIKRIIVLLSAIIMMVLMTACTAEESNEGLPVE